MNDVYFSENGQGVVGSELNIQIDHLELFGDVLGAAVVFVSLHGPLCRPFDSATFQTSLCFNTKAFLCAERARDNTIDGH